MADLFNQQISATYSGLLKTTSSGVLTSSLTQITDGRGNGSPLYISTVAINFYNAYTFPSTDGTADQVLKTDGAGAITWQDDANSGTVTSVALSVPTGLTVTGSPITTNGTITIGGTLGVANGGTGATTLTGILLGNGTSAISSITSANDGYILTADGVGGYAFEVASGGDVNVSGTPVADQIAIWTDATTIKGDPTLTIDTNGEIILVQDGQSGTPSRGMYNIGGGNMSFATGEENTGFGKQNLNNIEGGYHNTAVGAYSLFSSTGAVYNVAIGHKSLYSLIDKSNNTAVGSSAAFNYTGANSTFIGALSGNKRLSGNSNTAIGVNSLVGNSTVSLNTGNSNTAIGDASLNVVSSGSKNVALGKSSGSLITTGSSNVIIGSFTGTTGESPTPVYDIRTSSNNIVISDGDGNIRQTFDNSGNATFLGALSGTSATFSSYLSLGGYLTGQGTNPGGLGASRYVVDFNSGNTRIFSYGANISTAGGYLFYIQSSDGSISSTPLTIASTGAATFTNNVTIIGSSSNTAIGTTGQLQISSSTGVASPASDVYLQAVVDSETAGDRGTAFVVQTGRSSGIATRLTIASTGAATFSGDVSIGASSPDQKLTIQASGGYGLISYKKSDATTIAYVGISDGAGNVISTSSAGDLCLRVDGTNAILFSSTGNAERMRITSGGDVGIGTDSPVKTLDVQGQLAISNNATSYWYLDRNDSSGNFDIINDSNQVKLSITSGGNVGIGVTPSAWNTVTPVFQIGYTAFSAYQNTQAIYSSNAVYTSGWKYLSDTNATYYSQNEAAAGVHAWYTATSGTAGDPITFTETVRITSGGVLQANYGISFPNTAAPSIPANATTLNAYEEGTFTPTTNGDATGAFTGVVGEYTRIGNVINFRIACKVTTNFTSSSIGGLPYTTGGSGSPSGVLGGIIIFNASDSALVGRIDAGVTVITISSGNNVSSTIAPTTTMDVLRMIGTYRIN